jgi:hypothetical protein
MRALPANAHTRCTLFDGMAHLYIMHACTDWDVLWCAGRSAVVSSASASFSAIAAEALVRCLFKQEYNGRSRNCEEVQRQSYTARS